MDEPVHDHLPIAAKSTNPENIMKQAPQRPTATNPHARDKVGRIIFLSVVAAIGGFLFGFDSGVINGTVDGLSRAFDSDAIGTGFNVSSMLLGCMSGVFFAGALADRYGRKPVMIGAAVFFMVSAWGSGIAGTSGSFIFYRVLGGFAVGAASVLAPAYIAEIAPARIRGRLACLQQLMIVFGLFAAFLSNYMIANAAGGAGAALWGGHSAWRWMFWMEIGPAALFFALLLFIPESPRYLVAAGRDARARRVLESITSPQHAAAKVEEIKATVYRERKPRMTDVLIAGRRLVHPIVWAGVGLAALQQFTGINVVFYYGATLWQAAGFTESHALLTNVITGFVNIAFTCVAITLVDRIGRKPLLMTGALGQAATLGILAFVFGAAAQTDGGVELSGTAGIVALLAANGYIAFFALTWGPVVWVMLGEMFPNKFRGAALAMCGIILWGSNFIITMTFPILLNSVGLGVSYGLYASAGILGFFFVRRFIDETKGKTLEEMSLANEEGESRETRK